MTPASGVVLDYVAHAMYTRQCHERGTIGVRWLCMRADLQEAWRDKAREAAGDWWGDEQAAEVRRDAGVPHAFFGDRR